MREPISAAERLTLSGYDQQSLAFSYCPGWTTVSHILRETCSAIWKALGDIYVRPPSSPDDWREISKEFEDLWNLPHCVGAIDKKHDSMKCPNKSGSVYYNYKSSFSLGNLWFSLQFYFGRYWWLWGEILLSINYSSQEKKVFWIYSFNDSFRFSP